jgi:hypothetical protein
MDTSKDSGHTYSRNGKTYFSPIKMLVAPEANVLGTIDLNSINAREEQVALSRKMKKLKKKFSKGKGKGA